mgnify:CR=1 FL=1
MKFYLDHPDLNDQTGAAFLNIFQMNYDNYLVTKDVHLLTKDRYKEFVNAPCL